MRVILLTHYFPPEVGAPQARLRALASGLDSRGAAVTVHTGFPHYPNGRVFPPYRNVPWSTEWHHSERVVRSFVLPAPNRGFVRRLMDHAAFAVSSVLTQRVAGPADVVLVESPPLFLAAAGVAYASPKHAALVVNVADLWPDSAVDLGALTNPQAITAARALERFIYRHASLITVPTEGITKALKARPESASKVRYAPPFVRQELSQVAGVNRSRGPLEVLYAGTLGLAQGIRTLVEAAELVGEEHVKVTVAGSGAEEAMAREETRRRGLGNVHFLGTVPFEEIPYLYEEADAAVVLLRDRPVLHGALPTKVLEAMAAGRPVVFSGAGETAELIGNAACGRVVPPEDPHALARALRGLADTHESALRDLGERGRRASARFEQDQALDRWMTVLAEAASSQQP